MPEIAIKINNKIPKLCDENAFIIADNSDFSFCFEFDEEWEAYPMKTLKLVFDGDYTEKVFEGNTVTLPPISVERTQWINIGVYAGSLKTTVPLGIRVKASVHSGTGEERPIMPENAYDEAMRLFNEYLDDSRERIDELIRMLDTKLSLKGDNLDFDEETNLLYLTAGGERISDGITVVSSVGNGSGSVSGNNAVMTLSNTTGWLSATVSETARVSLSFNWSSLESEMPTGDGTLLVRIGSSRFSKNIKQGDVTLDLTGMLVTGINTVKLTVSDAYGNNRSLNFTVTLVSLSISSQFDASVPYSGDITYTYTPVGSANKTVHFKLDDEELEAVSVTSSGRQQSYVIPAQAHGAHRLEVWFTAMIDGEPIHSKHLLYELICVEEGNDTPIITTTFFDTDAAQYQTLSIGYYVYTPSQMTSPVTLLTDGVQVASLTVDRQLQTRSFRYDSFGTLTLSFVCGETVKDIVLNVTETKIDAQAETEGLELYLSAYGRSNSEESRDTWVYGDTECEFSSFNFASDGWQQDEDGVTVLRVSGDGRLYIPLEIFKDDFRTSGKTIEIEFATRDILDYDTTVISSYSGGRGLLVTAQKALLKSELSEVSTQYKENEHIRLSFTVEKRNENRLILVYLNGVISGAAQYSASDDFSQGEPVGITIGSNDCTTDIYSIRVYQNGLTRYQILDNFIADTQDLQTKLDRYERNHIYNAYGDIVIENLPQTLPYLVLNAQALPQFKGNKIELGGYYVDPVYPERSFEFSLGIFDVQGTSSQGYARKNYKGKFKSGFVSAGETSSTYKLRSDSIPTSTFTFKADVASSEGANNVELVRLYNEICPYKTPPQLEDSRIRQGIDGYPIVIFHDSGSGPKFIGKYNFNNDKGTAEVYGLTSGDESWEILNNTENRVLFKSADFSSDDWKNDFEARYPEDNEDISNLRRLCAFLASTDMQSATGKELEESVTYDGTEHTHDTAEYRLAKFKNGLGEYLNVEDAIFYYLFTEIFLMVDSRAKNLFPTRYAGEPFCFLPYDFDTAIGINNEGKLAFSYYLEDIDKVGTANVFNGQDSVLWVNLRRAFSDEIKAMYQQLRSDNKISYEIVNERFEAHQKIWPEAIWNEDAFYKYLEPLTTNNDSSYLGMLQGSKEEQRKWWLYNRFKYLDSKYEAGDSLSDKIVVRAYAKGDITVTPYADIYAVIKYGSYMVSQRALIGSGYTLPCPLENPNDTEIFIYSASQIKDLGDLSGLKLGYADFSKAVRLQSIKVGDSDENYSNENLTELSVGNSPMIRTVDARNCVNLGAGEVQQSVDLSGCRNIEYVYFNGTAIKGCSLPSGGILKVLHLPSSVTNLTIRNQPQLRDFYMPSYENITTLWLENVGAAVHAYEILEVMPEGSRVRITDIYEEFENLEELTDFVELFEKFRGIDESGNNTQTVQISGTLHISKIYPWEVEKIEELRTRLPYLNIEYDRIWKPTVTYMNGDVIVQQTEVDYGADCAYTGAEPTSDEEGAIFAGWYCEDGTQTATNVKCDKVYHAEIYVPSEQCGKTCYSYYDSTTDTLIVFGSGATYEHGFDSDSNATHGVWIPYKETVKHLRLQEGISAVGRDNDFASNCPNLTELTIPMSINKSGAFLSAFSYRCTLNVEKLHIQDWVSWIGIGTHGWEYAPISSENGMTVYFNGEMLSYDELNIFGVTAFGTNREHLFRNCLYKKVVINDLESTGKDTFYNSCQLEQVILDDSVTSILNGAFRYCTGLTSVIIPNSVTTIEGSAFNGCTSLKSITIPNSVTSISGSYTFTGCTSLESIEIPDNVTSLGEATFDSCTGLRSVTLGSGLTSIDGRSFKDCTGIINVTLKPSSLICSLNLRQSSLLSDDSIASIINGLADLTGQTAQTLILHNDVKARLTDEQTAAITSKNWTLA